MHDIPRDKFFALIKWLYVDKGEKVKWVMGSHATEEHTSPDLRPLLSPRIYVASTGPRTYQDLLRDKIKNRG